MASTFPAKLEEILGRLNNAAQDFSSLEITTVTGKVDFVIENDKFNFDKLTQHVKAGNLTLVAQHHIKFDQDAVLFVKEDLNDQQKELFALHMETLKSSREARLAFLNFIKEVLGL
jgi:hypothetical protein